MVMQSYETCLISISGKISLFALSDYFSDAAAIRAARHMCTHGELAQVWRGDVCIYKDRIPAGVLPDTGRTSPSSRQE
jgi:hypothetical protein